jgi:hypothetical protein
MTSALVSLASFLKDIDDPEFKAGEWKTPESSREDIIYMPYVDSSPTVMRFIEAAYENDWLETDLDWPEWAQTSRALWLRNSPGSISQAGESDIFRLLTVCIRQDKFVEGALLEAFDSGLIRRIVRRAASILAEKATSSTEESVTPPMSYRTYISVSRAAYIAGIEAGISPQELRAHTGVIGEAFVADYLGVKLSPVTHQHGYDLIDADGIRVSVKTITTSTHVTLNASTLHHVDRIVVVWLGTEADELDVVIVYDKSTEEFFEDSSLYQGNRRLGRAAMTFPSKPVGAGIFNVGDVVDTYQEGNMLFRKHSSGSFTVLVDNKPEPAFQHLLRLRDAWKLPDKANNTTRTLGAQVFGDPRSKGTH